MSGPETDSSSTPPENQPEQGRGVVLRRQQLERIVRDGSLNTEVYLELAALYRSEARPLEARRVLQQALQLNKDDPQVLWEFEEATLARSLQQMREVADLAARLHTPEVDREMKRAQADWANRRLEVCRARLKRDPTQAHLRLVVAEALYDLGMFNEACDELLPCLETDTTSPAAHLIRGKCMLDMGKDIDALAEFRAVAMRRAVPGPAKLRLTAMRHALDIAQRNQLALSIERYRHAMEAAEHDLAKEVG